MTEPDLRLGARKGPFYTGLPRDLVRRFAAATNDPNPRAIAGEAVPVVAMMTQAWEAFVVATETMVSDEVRRTAISGAHAEHDLIVHRPPRPEERFLTWAESWGSRPANGNAFLTVHYETRDVHDELVAEQWWTTVFLRGVCEETGKPLADHRFPEQARNHPVATYDIFIDKGLPRRWAEVTHDWAPIHFDPEMAKLAGFKRLAAHGLSTLATCAQGIVARLADGDPDQLRRLACRFASPAYVGEELHVQMYEAGPRTYAFEADCAGAKVIAHGLAELR